MWSEYEALRRRPVSTVTNADPLVSICIPTFQGAPWIKRTIASALAQDYPSLEIVISDDGSTDKTLAIAASFNDQRVRILPSGRRVGMAANWNRSISGARGAFIKFLMQDDLLAPDCVSQMVAIMQRSPSIGLVFSTRMLEPDDPLDPDAQHFIRRYARVHERLEPLGETNDGPRLVSLWTAHAPMGDNLLGEPTAVLVRRTAFERVGLFNLRLLQLTDAEMWLRLAASGDVGFVRRPLATFRVHAMSASARNKKTDAAWLDRVWMLQGLRQDPVLQLMVGWRSEMRVWAGTLKAEGLRQLQRVLTGRLPEIRRLGRDIREYFGWLHANPRTPLHGALPQPDPDE